MHRRSFAFPLLLLALYPCEDTGLRVRPDAGTAPIEDAGGADTGRPRDAGIPTMVFAYTPEGCGYEVSTPDVRGPARGGDEGAALPDHVHVGFGGDPQTSFAINWRSATDTTLSYVLFGTDEAAVTAADAAGEGVTQQRGHTFVMASTFDREGTRIHEVHVCGLTAGTTYWYKVGGPGAWSEVYDYATAPTQGTTDAWSFGVSGDSRNNVDNAWPLSQQRMMSHGIDLQVFSGDAVFIGALQTDWDEFFGATVDEFSISDLHARVPFMPSNGNHDALAVNYLSQFAVPQDVSDQERGQGEEWYSFDYGNAHFVILNDTVLDNGVLAGAQGRWLDDDLAAVDRTRTPWVFAVHHRPFYTCESNHRPDLDLRTAWQPIFDRHEVDIVFTGHNHVYERSRPIRGLEGGVGTIAASGTGGVPIIDGPGVGSGRPSGTIYLVAAGVGAPLYSVSTACPFTFDARAEPNYGVVEIEDRTLTWTARNVLTDAVVDTFTYTK
ncbi:MAG: fibronectin type III domain-containing protein [Polyangiales bacterium]